MDDITSGALVSDPETRRALQLDTLSAILPMERRDRLAELLTDDDVETLKHLAREGMGENSLRALASDLAYLEAWAQAATGAALPWPASESLALKFVAHHLWDTAKREVDPQHGMPAAVAAKLREALLLRSDGPHAPSTVKRRLASWGTLHRWKGHEGPFCSPSLRAALRSRSGPAPGRGSARASGRSPVTSSTVCSPPAGPTGWPTPAISPSCCSPSPPAGAAAARWRGCGSSSLVMNRRSRSMLRTRTQRRCRAFPFSSAAPRPDKRTRRRGCCWSGLRSRRCANGSSGRTSARGRSSARSTVGRRWRRGRLRRSRSI
jgi:hypothetical protein